MSDKYYLHDCNSYTHSCQNTYRIECTDSADKIEVVNQPLAEQRKQLKWWQRLWERDVQQARP